MTTEAGPTVVEAFVESGDRTTLFLRAWRPAAPRAILAAVHAPDSDGSRYRGLAETLAARGIASCAIDLRGCGRSVHEARQRLSLAAYLRDVHAMVSHARRCDPALPLFLAGHGLGAALACRYAARHDGALEGLICESILLPPGRGGAFLRRFPRLSRTLLPSDAPATGVGGAWRDTLAALDLPLLLLHGSDDRRAATVDSEYLHRHVASGDKTLQIFEGHGHDLLAGPGHAPVQARVCQWLEAELDSRRGRRRIGIEYINE